MNKLDMYSVVSGVFGATFAFNFLSLLFYLATDTSFYDLSNQSELYVRLKFHLVTISMILSFAYLVINKDKRKIKKLI